MIATFMISMRIATRTIEIFRAFIARINFQFYILTLIIRFIFIARNGLKLQVF